MGWRAIERGYRGAPVARARAGFVVTLADLRTAELVLGGDEAVEVDADAEVGRGLAIVANRIVLEVHHEQMAGTRGAHTQTDVKSADVIKKIKLHVRSTVATWQRVGVDPWVGGADGVSFLD